MGEISIKVEIKNKEIPYKYEGIASLNKDLISYTHDDYNYIYDLKINRFIKTGKDSVITIDFDKEEVIIDNKYNLKIKVINKVIDEKFRNIIYNIDNNEIEFKLEVI